MPPATLAAGAASAVYSPLLCTPASAPRTAHSAPSATVLHTTPNFDAQWLVCCAAGASSSTVPLAALIAGAARAIDSSLLCTSASAPRTAHGAPPATVLHTTPNFDAQWLAYCAAGASSSSVPPVALIAGAAIAIDSPLLCTSATVPRTAHRAPSAIYSHATPNWLYCTAGASSSSVPPAALIAGAARAIDSSLLCTAAAAPRTAHSAPCITGWHATANWLAATPPAPHLAPRPPLRVCAPRKAMTARLLRFRLHQRRGGCSARSLRPSRM